MSCETNCFELKIDCCESPVIRAGLTAGATLMALISQPNKHTIFKREVIVDADGNITIDKNTLPDGFFGYGFIKVELRKGAGFTEVQTMKFNTVDYNCLIMEISTTDVVPEEPVIA